jgi:hypothetical protein
MFKILNNFRAIAVYALIVLLLTLNSCSNNEVFQEETTEDVVNSPISESDIKLSSDCSAPSLYIKFAKLLSKVTYKNKEVRQFLKKEALTEFDRNNDILWIKVCDENIGGKTLKQIFEEESSPEFISELEEQLPLLNILFPELITEGISAETYNPDEEDLPVVLLGKDKNYLFYNGECTEFLEENEVPGLNILIINENKRVRVNSTTRSNSSERYTFINPYFDNSHSTKYAEVELDKIGDRAIKAFQYFYSKDGGPNSNAYQRDFIYYGVTPDGDINKRISNITEYICYIEVDPRIYGLIADQDGDAKLHDTYQENERKISALTDKEVIDNFWTVGSYTFNICVHTSKEKNPYLQPVTGSPSDFWNFNVKREKTRHATRFRHSKWKTTIFLGDFTAKPYYIEKRTMRSLGKWDLSQESLERHVIIYEDDAQETQTKEESYDFTDVVKNDYSNDVKVTYSYQKENTNTSNNEIKYNYNEVVTRRKSYHIIKTFTLGSDKVGEGDIYYNDPIIEDIVGGIYNIHTYTFGDFTFGITAR